jgi:hypothetical protein
MHARTRSDGIHASNRSGSRRTADVEPCLQEHILDGIGCSFLVPKDQAGRSVQAVRGARGQRREGVEIALL